MLSLAEAGNKNVAPNVRIYNHVLSAIASSGLPDDIQRASKIIKLMKDNGISPDEYTRKATAKVTKGLGKQSA
jgi:pentatricopeptide repeat protein